MSSRSPYEFPDEEPSILWFVGCLIALSILALALVIHFSFRDETAPAARKPIAVVQSAIV